MFPFLIGLPWAHYLSDFRSNYLFIRDRILMPLQSQILMALPLIPNPITSPTQVNCLFDFQCLMDFNQVTQDSGSDLNLVSAITHRPLHRLTRNNFRCAAIEPPYIPAICGRLSGSSTPVSQRGVMLRQVQICRSRSFCGKGEICQPNLTLGGVVFGI